MASNAAACDGAGQLLMKPQKQFVHTSSKSNSEQVVRFPGVVGVHIGAGQHSLARTEKYLSICANACSAAVEMLRAEDDCALDAAMTGERI